MKHTPSEGELKKFVVACSINDVSLILASSCTTVDMASIWQILGCHYDVCRATNGANIELQYIHRFWMYQA